jgi:hypothetical protein
LLDNSIIPENPLFAIIYFSYFNKFFAKSSKICHNKYRLYIKAEVTYDIDMLILLTNCPEAYSSADKNPKNRQSLFQIQELPAIFLFIL